MPALRLWLVPAFISVLALAWYKGRLPLLVIAVYGVVCTVTFVLYAIDKSAARRQLRRTPERTLHVLSLAGGWPGALLAQELLRHKTSKRAFLRIFWLMVLLHCAALGWYLERMTP
jgi:uncharacterized membrane protein YsdA (DUF1294 family)